VDQPTYTKEPLHVSNWSITRFKAKALKEALNRLVVRVSAKAKLGDPLDYQQEGLSTFNLYVRGIKSTLIWAMKFQQQGFQYCISFDQPFSVMFLYVWILN
jgi:hypothetical protein